MRRQQLDTSSTVLALTGSMTGRTRTSPGMIFPRTFHEFVFATPVEQATEGSSFHANRPQSCLLVTLTPIHNPIALIVFCSFWTLFLLLATVRTSLSSG